MTFRLQTLLAVGAVVLALATSLLVGIEVLVHPQARAALEAELDADRAGFEAQLRAGEERLAAEARLVAEEPRLKAVLLTPGIARATVEDVAQELRRAVGWDVLLLADADGTLFLSGGATGCAPPALLSGGLDAGRSVGFWSCDGRFYQLAAARLSYSGAPSGALAAGNALSDERLAGMRLLLTADVAVFAGGTLIASSIRPGALRTELAQQGGVPTRELELASSRYLARTVRLDDRTMALVFRSEEGVLAPYHRLRRTLGVLAAIALGIGALVAWLLSRQLSRPVGELVALAKAVGRGDLEVRARPGGAREIEELGQALNEMVAQLVAHRAEAQRSEAERQKTQASLLTSDRLASVGTLAAGVAHEINNPLAYVTANLEYAVDALRVAEGPTRALIEVLEDARQGAERVRVIVRDLKTFSRADDQSRGPVEVCGVVELAINMTANEIRHRARLVKDLSPVPPVAANESRLGQVLVNLLVNACHAIPEGQRTLSEVRISTRLHASGRVAIEVTDTGCGIPPEIRDRIFDPFFTTKPVGTGTGLGLSICHTLVAGFGGELQVESEVGVGSTFRVLLQPAEGREAFITPAAADAPAARRGRVLIVDDEPLVCTAIRRLLPEHDVEMVTEAQAALEQAARGGFDVILCDLMMPDMGGDELHARLSRSSPQAAARMVFLTGGAFTPRTQQFLAERPGAWLEKPIDGARLRRMVRSFVQA